MSTLLQTKRLIWSAVFALVTLVALLSYFSGRRYLAAVSAVEHTLSVESATQPGGAAPKKALTTGVSGV